MCFYSKFPISVDVVPSDLSFKKIGMLDPQQYP